MNESDKKMIYEYINNKKYAVEATVDFKNRPQAAVVGIAITTDLELIFDTEKTTRKYINFLKNPAMAFVVGWDETTVQLDGIAREISPIEMPKYKAIYFKKFPDGLIREKWPEIVYLSFTPYWIRFSDFSKPDAQIKEWKIQ